MPLVLTPAQRARDLAVRDLTDPAAGPHAVQLVVDAAVAALSAAWGPSVEVRLGRGPRVVDLADNYDRLRYPAAAVTRDARHTRYVDDGHVLRSHTSALVPPALRRLAADAAHGTAPDDVLLACPGVTYRRDAIDRLHTGTPHQLDLWRIARRPLGIGDLAGMVRALLDTLLPGRTWRWAARTHPYTLLGRQVDVLDGDEWVEVGECGLAHPEVLAGAGLPPEGDGPEGGRPGWSGLALGVGLDRLVMLRKGVPDIRLLRSDDPRVAAQMTDLAPYRPVSALPAVTRDLSLAVPADDAVEDLGDRVREALGPDADLLEAVEVLSRTAWDEVPPAARARLGMDRSQANVLVRIVVRPLDRTLTDGEANALRDRAYAALHRGGSAQWAAAAP